jgi:hypothetical protein
MRTQYSCQLPRRVAELRKAVVNGVPKLNGIDYLEVDASQTRLVVTFVHDLALVPATALARTNVEIVGGERVVNPRVLSVSAMGRALTVEVETPGDFSAYRLRLVASSATGEPPPGIDPALAEVEFSFKVDCPSDFDCATERDCPPEKTTAPVIDYLAKDYTSFRRLMLDRLSVLMPGVTERSPADLWVTLCELVAYRADELSYYQDAVATEAYLGTARRRISVRRHARLLDYPFHDGSNARVWVAFEVDAGGDGQLLAGPRLTEGGTQLLTTIRGEAGAGVDATTAARAVSGGALAFETLHDARLYQAHNRMRFYTWSDEECCLPRGATRAFLRDQGLRLRAGDVLVFVEEKSPDNGAPADADPARRHAVRLTRVLPEVPVSPDGQRGNPTALRDPLNDTAYFEVQWDEEDALPFPLCISKRFSDGLVTDMVVALGNVALADHGRTETREEWEPVPTNRKYRPRITRGPLTQQAFVRRRAGGQRVLIDFAASAAAALRWNLADVQPAVVLADERGDYWQACADLVSSDRFAREFVVETEDDGTSYLRFGDGASGRAPTAGDRFSAVYRTGNGLVGNIGAGTIRHVVIRQGMDWARSTALKVFNPLPATGGQESHSVQQAKLYAPQAFRYQERAVTPDDYARAAERHPDVQRAVATRRWTGSWYTTFISVDRRGGRPVNAEFETELTRFLDRYRLAGHDLEIESPRLVSVDIRLEVCVKRGYFAPAVKVALLKTFSDDRLRSGQNGFFHPDEFTFGEPVYLSQVVARAMTVEGVLSVKAARFQRWGQLPNNEIENGLIPMASLEIARAANDPNAPEQGRVEFEMLGGA